ncbi:MAG: hypothetical protein O8C61_12700 [Candidatus Methanoperedens sp.]|nr:hypothetical protein [Candidatus Methanoperedens sp.]
MNPKNIIFLIFILGSLFFSGCLKEEEVGAISTSPEVMYSQAEDGTLLTIFPNIRNDMSVDTGILTLKVNIKDPSTNLIVATKDADIGYIKSKNTASNSLSLKVTDPGEYLVEVQVFEGSKLITQSFTQVTVKAKPAQGQPSDIKLTDMNLVITKLLNDGTTAVVEISPGLYNQGGDSKPLTLEVTAQIDPYNTYIQSDSINVVKSTDRVRGKVTFTIPRNKEYSFSVKVLENGKEVALAKVNDKIKLNTIKYNEPKNYVLVEEGKPVETAAATATPKEPGFQGIVALMGLMLVYGIMKWNRKGE